MEREFGSVLYTSNMCKDESSLELWFDWLPTKPDLAKEAFFL